MLDRIMRFFNGGAIGNGIAAAAQGHDLRVAVCALFLEIGRIDETFSQSEMAMVLSILKERYGLSEEDADGLLQEAGRALDDAVDYFRFADLINRHYSTEEKIGIVELLWRIVFVDGKMDRYEHYLMNKLGNLLRLSHGQLMDAKMKILHPDSGT